jgi:DNA-3-methyladenine glycosylase II
MITPQVLDHLRRDPILAPLLDRISLPAYEREADVYARLIRAIVFQQLSGKAASTIHGRFLGLFPDGYPHPDALLALDLPALRSVGLSQQKSTYIQNIARYFLEHNLFDQNWDDRSDQEVLDLLTPIKGVGYWTVEMLLMFTLDRPDVLPLDDLGIQQAMQGLYNLDGKGKVLQRQMTETAEPWRPYRTYACYYLWRWKDGEY